MESTIVRFETLKVNVTNDGNQVAEIGVCKLENPKVIISQMRVLHEFIEQNGIDLKVSYCLRKPDFYHSFHGSVREFNELTQSVKNLDPIKIPESI